MANYRKSFNFRSGVQVDNDSFIVDPRGNVGIGTSIANRPLDVYGSARINGNFAAESLQVSLGSTFSSLVSIGESILANPNSGIITAVSYRGDGTLLAGVIAIATNGWIVNSGTLSTSYNAYIGPFDPQAGPGEGLEFLPVAEGLLQVGKGSSTFTVQSNGLVGLGTTIPRARLDVNGGASISGVTTLGHQLRMQKNYALYMGMSGDTPTGLVIRHTDSLGAEIVNVSNQGGDDRKITIESNRDGDIVLKGQYSNRAVFSASGVNITGTTDTDQLIVSGVSTFTGSVDANGDLDVDGLAELDDVNVSGILTTNNLNATNHTDLNNLNVSGVGTVATLDVTGSGIFDSNILVGNDIQLASGVITATTFIGDLTGTASLATSLADGANIVTGTISDERLPNLITSNLSTVAGISTINKIRVETLGIGTDTFTSDIALVKDSSVRMEVISTQGSATIGLGQSETGGDNSAGIKYNTITETLDLTSYGSGDVTFHVHKGTGALVGPQTGGFLFKSGSVDKVLLNIGSDGRVSINEELPEISDLEYSLIVSGNAKVRGELNLDQGINSVGIVTALSLNLTEAGSFPTTQNFNTQSGISTFYQLEVANQFTSVGFSSFIGITTFFGGFETAAVSQFNDVTTVNGTTLGLSTSNFFYDYVGGITTGFNDPRDQAKLVPLTLDPAHTILPFSGYGDMQIRTGGMNIITQDYIAVHPSLTEATDGNWPGLTPAENLGMGLEFINWNLCKVGINTLYIRSIFDVGYGNSSNSCYFIPPRLSTNEVYYVSQLWNDQVGADWQGHARAKLATPDGLVTGGIVFDHQRTQLKVATGSTTFCGIATFTNNHSGYESFVPPKVTNTQRTTLTNAGIPAGSVVYNTTNNALEQYDGTNWTSYVKKSTSDDISISVNGSNIVITVAGIGSTSLTLV